MHEYVDLLIKQIQTHATDKPEGEEMVKWYNYITFDIIGDLAFGDPFGSLKSGMFILSKYQLTGFNTNILYS